MQWRSRVIAGLFPHATCAVSSAGVLGHIVPNSVFALQAQLLVTSLHWPSALHWRDSEPLSAPSKHGSTRVSPHAVIGHITYPSPIA